MHSTNRKGHVVNGNQSAAGVAESHMFYALLALRFYNSLLCEIFEVTFHLQCCSGDATESFTFVSSTRDAQLRRHCFDNSAKESADLGAITGGTRERLPDHLAPQSVTIKHSGFCLRANNAPKKKKKSHTGLHSSTALTLVASRTSLCSV